MRRERGKARRPWREAAFPSRATAHRREGRAAMVPVTAASIAAVLATVVRIAISWQRRERRKRERGKGKGSTVVVHNGGERGEAAFNRGRRRSLAVTLAEFRDGGKEERDFSPSMVALSRSWQRLSRGEQEKKTTRTCSGEGTGDHASPRRRPWGQSPSSPSSLCFISYVTVFFCRLMAMEQQWKLKKTTGG